MSDIKLHVHLSYVNLMKGFVKGQVIAHLV